MTVMMTSKNQITIPKKITRELHLEEGALFDIQIKGNRLELIPLETIEKIFTDEEYTKMNELCARERHLAKPVTQAFIDSLTKKS